MAPKQEIVITGLGVVNPIGIGNDAFWASLCEGRSGVRRLELYDTERLSTLFGAVVDDFEPKQYVRPRKSLKVMSRDIQLGFAAAELACTQASVQDAGVDPDRLGIVYGAEMIPCDPVELADAYRGCITNGKFDFDRWGQTAMAEMYPLWMLKYLPNMPACHVGIACDARGPNNSLTLGEVSCLSAVAEAVRVIDRDHADMIISGGVGTRINLSTWGRNEIYGASHRGDDPTAACRPFDARRDGMVGGEGAGAFVLERRAHAEARGATILASILGFAGAFEPNRNGQSLEGRAIRQSITGALHNAQLTVADVGYVSASGNSTVPDDRMEAAAIHDTLGDVPVTAPKSLFGNHGAGAGAAEMAASVLALQHATVPPTRNYEYPDPECPVNVVHGRPMEIDKPTALVLNHTHFGQAAAVLLAAP